MIRKTKPTSGTRTFVRSFVVRVKKRETDYGACENQSTTNVLIMSFEHTRSHRTEHGEQKNLPTDSYENE